MSDQNRKAVKDQIPGIKSALAHIPLTPYVNRGTLNWTLNVKIPGTRIP